MGTFPYGDTAPSVPITGPALYRYNIDFSRVIIDREYFSICRFAPPPSFCTQIHRLIMFDAWDGGKRNKNRVKKDE